jgi:hypothetical protein
LHNISGKRVVSHEPTLGRDPRGGAGGQIKSLRVPQTELRQFENPCRQFVDDYDNVLEDHGVSLDDVRLLATTYDQLRQMRR